MANTINVIKPYKWNGMWVFDDENTNLLREAFVAGIDTIIDVAVEAKEIDDPDNGFLVVFSDSEFPGYDYVLNWVKRFGSGNIYSATMEENGGDQTKMEGWLCGALYLYYEKAPQNLFVQIKSIDERKGKE